MLAPFFERGAMHIKPVVCYGATLGGVQSSFCQGAHGTIWSAEDGTQVSCVQFGKPFHITITPALYLSIVNLKKYPDHFLHGSFPLLMKSRSIIF